ncbi:acyl carrier protein [Paenibacillus illinoisensis]|uniref:acyl carrier protein n=1 Tax=Paenibacillus illinoisensis TaxID=59845 RepID=UPI001C8E214D|nr:acyl carrier protein [Paenibacillus illinoisensis]MBY0217736.1 acyl carrier protein [Paenibacillus illinoisensis]
MDMNIYQGIVEIITEISEDGQTLEDISPNSQLEGLGINSLTFVKMLVKLEIEFDIEFEDSELMYDSSKTVQDIINVIRLKQE